MLAFVLAAFYQGESPHGKTLELSCDLCHGTDNWDYVKDLGFNHNSTSFPLIGQHYSVNCKICHESLVFSEAEPECISCHTDIHQESVGMECNRCHTPQSWIVNNIIEIHQLGRFPLTGPHLMANCSDCHISASQLYFPPLGIECFDCHMDDYSSTTDPNHSDAGFSTDCLECHYMNSFSWGGVGINHNFFPLTAGHDISNCTLCHKDGDYANISSECISCHEQDYNNSSNPSHEAAGISTNCAECHSTNPGWRPASFYEHDGLFFPIYSGEHAGVWGTCMECHPNTANYAVYTCISCHEHNQADMDDEHEGISGYTYENSACLICHPTGSAEEGFDHNQSAFPLTGEHIVTDCADCHANGYAGTPTDCFSCHEMDYQSSQNPAHVNLGLSSNCEDCHTTQADWKPATFSNHNDYYALIGAHNAISNDCAQCHNGNYVNTPNTCIGCHQDEYNQSNDPPHASAQFPTDCELCHNQNVWEPSTFNHDGLYFPIYNGSHNGEWGSCSDCHTNSSNYAEFSCINCHEHNQTDMDDEHNEVSGYIYNSMACFDCHPNGEAALLLRKRKIKSPDGDNR